MYPNKFPPLSASRDAIKCNKIFRPWDSVRNETVVNNKLEECAQDSTISTTTENEEPPAYEFDEIVYKAKPETVSKPLRKPETKIISNKTNYEIKEVTHHKLDESFSTKCSKTAGVSGREKSASVPRGTNGCSVLTPDYSASLEGYPMYPEIVQANLASSLGLPPSDPFFMECISQGYSLEEYARVLSQEHQAKILQTRKQRPKKYRCPHCDVGFSNNGQLKGHIRIHTGERPFRCDEKNCGKTFTRNEELTRHKRIHSGLRPFACTHCGKRFGRKDHLKKHSRTHFQPRALYAVPVMLPFDTWTPSSAYPYVPMFGY